MGYSIIWLLCVIVSAICVGIAEIKKPSKTECQLEGLLAWAGFCLFGPVALPFCIVLVMKAGLTDREDT